MTQRTAVCVTSVGHLYYAWSAQRSTAARWARRLRQAGCQYAMHLDMNPGALRVRVRRHRESAREGEDQLKLATRRA